MAVESPDRASIAATASARVQSPVASGHWAQTWRQLRRDRAALVGAAIIISLIVIAILGALQRWAGRHG